MSNQTDGTDARLSVLETEVQGIKSSINDLTRSVTRYMERQNEQRPAIPFKEIMSTAVCTVVLIGALVGALDYWSDKKAAVAEYRLSILEKHAPSSK